MAVVLIEGFDNYPADGWSGEDLTSFGAGNPSGSGQVSPRVGNGKGWQVSIGSGGVSTSAYRYRKVLPSTYSTLIAGFALLRVNSRTDTDVISFSQTGGTSILSMRLDSNTAPYLFSNAGGGVTKTLDVAGFQALGGWNYYEIKVVIAGGSSTVEMWINGVRQIAPATLNCGSTNIGSFAIQSAGGGGSLSNQFDDIYCADTTGPAPRNTFLGDCRVQTIYPTAAGNSTTWTPNTATNWQDVKEPFVPDNDTTYVSSSTPGAVDTYTTGDLDALTGTIFGVQVNVYARKDDAGTRIVAPVIRQGGTDYVGSNIGLTTTYASSRQIYQQDPTGADWTIANVNADEFGVKMVAPFIARPINIALAPALATRARRKTKSFLPQVVL